jgi:hypothetical protein
MVGQSKPDFELATVELHTPRHKGAIALPHWSAVNIIESSGDDMHTNDFRSSETAPTNSSNLVRPARLS